MTVRRGLLLAGAFGGALLLAGAGDAPPPAATALAAAHDLLTTMHTESNALTILDKLRSVLIEGIRARTSKPADEVARVVDEVLMPEVRSRISEFVDALAAVQASVYTVEEMRQLRAFYESPLGRRVIELTPRVAALSFTAGQDWGRRVAEEALHRKADELRRRGVEL